MLAKERIIGLCGKIGHGKSLTGALLCAAGFEVRSFAGPLRSEVFRALERLDPFLDIELMPEAVAQAWLSARSSDIFAKPTPAYMRVILQWWGTEYRRSGDADYWVKRAAEGLLPPTVFTDTRFQNEVDAIRIRGGVIWEVRRPDATAVNNGIKGHASEGLVIEPDLVLPNDCTLEEYATRVRDAINNTFHVPRSVGALSGLRSPV